MMQKMTQHTSTVQGLDMNRTRKAHVFFQSVAPCCTLLRTVTRLLHTLQHQTFLVPGQQAAPQGDGEVQLRRICTCA
jgi:hypothetical protein